ncbi:MAG: hypothetical protein M1836_000602 [Candelina mexicana]|nr:MAG: hypothetical protein M1836_000602 [Candelina mexicana]
MEKAHEIKQEMEETHQERETRKAGDFKSVESSMPAVASRIDPTTIADNLSSYLGTHNPWGHPVAATDAVWLLDNTAHRSQTFPHHWQAEFVAAYFLKDSGKDVGSVVADIAEKIGLGAEGKDEKEVESLIKSRVQPFLDAILPARTVKIDFGGPKGDRDIKNLGPAGRNGVSSQTVKISGEHNDKEQIKSEAIMPNDDDVTMVTEFAETEGWGFISDIDDSIKTTLTSSPIGILRTTFAETPKPIPGMPSLYNHISQTLSPTWFYLSASPYNLYPFLHTFISQTYPHGTILLRDSSWLNLAGFIANLTQGTQKYKVDRMQKIHDWVPKRKMICLGDSTQTDAEAYGEIYRKHEGWVKKIYIRKVTDVAEMGKTDKNLDERFEKAFEGVPRDVWMAFEDPNEVYESLDKLMQE